jgi:hypothetical protein
MPRLPLRFLADEHVGHSVVEYLVSISDGVIEALDHFGGPGTPDKSLVVLAEAEGLVIVSHDQGFLQRVPQCPINYYREGEARPGVLLIDGDGVTKKQVEILQNNIRYLEFFCEELFKRGQRFHAEPLAGESHFDQNLVLIGEFLGCLCAAKRDHETK